MLRLIVFLLVIVIVLSLAMMRLLPGPPPARPTTGTNKTIAPALDLPPAEQCPTLSLRERTDLAQRLHHLGERLRIDLPEGTSEAALTTARRPRSIKN